MGKGYKFSSHVLKAFAFYSICTFFNLGNGHPIDSCPQKAESCNANLNGNNSLAVGCIPCNHEYMSAYYSNKHDNILDSEFLDFLTRNFWSTDFCEETVHNINMLELSDVKRDLTGEGSHRNIVSNIRLNLQSNDLNLLGDNLCEVVIIERLPIGVFADPFELDHLAERKVLSSAAVFGDTNLEAPSALSNRSVVEIHMDIGHNIERKISALAVQLPLHARYPPLDPSGYARVIIGNPDIFLRCRPKYLQNENCFWAVRNLGFEANSVIWRIPCGDEALARIVSGITFGSALFCSLIIVFAAIHFSKNNDMKAL